MDQLRGRRLLEVERPERVPFLPLLPFAEGATVARVEQALQVLDRRVPRPRTIELQGTLVTFAGAVFPGIPWLARIPEEIRMKSTVLNEMRALGSAEGGARVVAKLLRHRLGRSRKVDALVKRLPSCTETTLDRISILILDQDKTDLLASIERLMRSGGVT